MSLSGEKYGRYQMFERHITIPVEDLRFLELYCGNCGNGFLVDLDNEAAGFPQQCPCCPAGTPPKIDTDLPGKVIKFREFRKGLRGFRRGQPQFRIKEE